MLRRPSPSSIAKRALIVVPVLLIAAKVAADRFQHPTQLIPLRVDSALPMTYSPDSRSIAVMFRDYDGAIYDAQSGELRQSLHLPSQAANLSPPVWSPDSTKVVACFQNFREGQGEPKTEIGCWDADSGKYLHQWPYPVDGLHEIGDVEFSRDGQLLLSTVGELVALDIESGKVVKRIKVGEMKDFSSQLDPQQKFVAFIQRSSRQGEVHSLPGGEAVSGLEALRFGWSGACQQGLVLRNNDLWEYESRKIIKGPGSGSYARICDQSGLMAYMAGASKSKPGEPRELASVLRVWDYKQQKELWNSPLPSLAGIPHWSPDGKWISFELVTTSLETDSDQTVLIYDVQGKERFSKKMTTPFQQLWSPDSKTLAVMTHEGIELVAVEDL